MSAIADAFEDRWPRPGGASAAFVVDLNGFEGPLDTLLALARRQKVDLARISILELADQYLAFVAAARDIPLALAADYLVMAAWLAYLKSRLLLPGGEEEEEPAPGLMAEALQFHLQRLEAMREVSRQLMARPQLGREFFRGGSHRALPVEDEIVWEASLFELLRAYGDHRKRREGRSWRPEPVTLFTVERALERLRPLVGGLPQWRDLMALLPEGVKVGAVFRSAVGATLAASLELARQGEIELRQAGAFAPLALRSRRRKGR